MRKKLALATSQRDALATHENDDVSTVSNFGRDGDVARIKWRLFASETLRNAEMCVVKDAEESLESLAELRIKLEESTRDNKNAVSTLEEDEFAPHRVARRGVRLKTSAQRSVLVEKRNCLHAVVVQNNPVRFRRVTRRRSRGSSASRASSTHRARLKLVPDVCDARDAKISHARRHPSGNTQR